MRFLVGTVTLTEKYYAHLAPSNLSSAVKRLEIGEGEKSPVPKTVPNCTKNGISDSENPDDALLLTDSFERCYVPEVALLAGVAKLAYAADSKTRFCSFCPLRNSSQQLETKEEKNTDDLRPFFGILGNF